MSKLNSPGGNDKLDFKYTFHWKSHFSKAEHLINSCLISLIVSSSKRSRKLLGKSVLGNYPFCILAALKKKKEEEQSVERNQCNFPGNYWQDQILNWRNTRRKATYLNITVILTVRIMSEVLKSKMNCGVWKMLRLTKILNYVRGFPGKQN